MCVLGLHLAIKEHVDTSYLNITTVVNETSFEIKIERQV